MSNYELIKRQYEQHQEHPFPAKLWSSEKLMQTPLMFQKQGK